MLAEVIPALLAWYRAERRDLPWRRTRDPYAVWLSEVMLQQTQVATVIPYWERFLALYPTVEALADAPQEQVLAHWAGLGYYSRGRNLHAAAAEVTRRGTGFPRTAAALEDLPGVGRYTAAAVASICFDEPVAVLDGNVARVLARVLAVADDVTRPAVRARLWDAAAALVPADAPGDFNQAMMELGATICTPRAPDCPRCPLRPACVAHAQGRTAELPVPRYRRVRKASERLCLVVHDGVQVLVRRRSQRGLLAGTLELPNWDREGDLRAQAEYQLGVLGFWAPGPVQTHPSVRHLFTHIDMVLWPVQARVDHPSGDHQWLPLAELATLPTVMRKVAAACFPGAPR